MIGLAPGTVAAAKATAAAAIALGLVVAIGTAWVAGNRHGHQAEKTSDEARERGERIERLEADNAQLQVRLGQAAAVTASDQRSVMNLHERLSATQQAAANLQERVGHVRLVFAPSAGVCDGAGRGLAAGDAAAGGGAVGQPNVAGAGVAAAPGAPDAAGLDADRVPLTLAAVGLYDNALFAGEPGATELGPVACRAFGTAGAAADAHRCEAFSGVYLDDLFRVHFDNAASCAADRERLGRLIEAVKARERIYGASTP